jgi:glycerol dehydrogenase-like iron-containing ADH family enzyme
MTLINFSKTLEFKSGGIFKKEICDIFLGYQEKISQPKNFLVVCDEGTKYIALKFTDKPFVLSSIKLLEEELRNHDGIFAVGSGTVCDASKFASFNAKKPLISFATALSMNGYLSSNASILAPNGEKKSFKCHLPKALYFDLKILEEAPTNLTKAGFGDAMARITAQNDCLLSHKEKGTKYDEELFSFRIPSENFLLENYKKLPEKDDEFMLELLENTLFSGLAMHLFGSSFPASGGEHAMAHASELRMPKIRKFLHGFQISAFTCEMLKIQGSDDKTLKNAFTYLQMPSCYQDLGLTEEEFLEVKTLAKTIRDRYGFLNLN